MHTLDSTICRWQLRQAISATTYTEHTAATATTTTTCMQPWIQSTHAAPTHRAQWQPPQPSRHTHATTSACVQPCSMDLGSACCTD
eukprot:363835-Chlamydomonas_euryale.AAC.1